MLVPTEKIPSRQVLIALPSRAGVFLRAVSRSLAIRGALEERGYDESQHQRGWPAYLTVSGYRPTPSAEEATEDAEIALALAAIDAWDEPNFRIIRAALEWNHPEACAFLFDQLEPATGAASIGTVSLFLDRLDQLEKSPERKATRKADHAALATVEQRGVTPSERARMRALLETVTGWTGAAPPPAKSVEEANEEDKPSPAMLALYAWYREWTETARVVIKRRDHLVRLGLAKRKAGKTLESKPEGTAEAPRES